MNRNTQGEEGWALVTAVVLMSIMMGLGLAAFSMSDNQNQQARVERERESQLNLTEGVLSSQIFALSRNWPATAVGAYPTSCTEGSTDAAFCPEPTRVRNHYSAVDFKRGSTWNVHVRDNGGTAKHLFTDAVLTTQPRWDADGDGMLWVRAEGRLAGKARILVSRVKVEHLPIDFPRAPFVAGSVETSNAGGHGGRVLINTNGSPGQVRCYEPNVPSRSSTCINYTPHQVNGTTTSDPTLPPNVITGEVLDALRQTARANNTHYNTCPSLTSQYTGKVVFIEQGDCDFRSNSPVNSPTAGGLLIVNRGTFKCTGNTYWYGVIYMVNAQDSSGTVFDNTGGCTIYGAVFIDGPGHLAIGSNAPNLVYDPSLIFNATAYGTAGIVQNTWRELPSP